MGESWTSQVDSALYPIENKDSYHFQIMAKVVADLQFGDIHERTSKRSLNLSKKMRDWAVISLTLLAL